MMLTFKGVATYVTYKIANVLVYKGVLFKFVFGAKCLEAYVAFEIASVFKGVLLEFLLGAECLGTHIAFEVANVEYSVSCRMLVLVVAF